MPDLSNPHDLFFKEVLSNKEVAQDFLRNYLPQDVVGQIDLDSVELTKDSFVDSGLKEHFSDLLHRVTLKNGDNAFVYILFEHKSAPEPHAPFQLLRYMMKIWEQCLNQNQPLSVIIPILVYHGKRKWKVGTAFSSMFPASGEMARYVPDFEYDLIDLSAFKDEEIKGAVRLRVAFMLLKYIFSAEINERMPEIFRFLQELENKESALEFLRTALLYLSSANDRVTENDISNAIKAAVPKPGGTEMPTLAEKWMAQGIEKGKAEGKIEGLIEGLQEGILLALEIKFGEQSLKLEKRLRQIVSMEQLKALETAVRTSKTLPDIETLL